MIKKGNIKSPLLSGFIVGLTVVLMEKFMPDLNILIKILIIGVSALLSGVITNRLFLTDKQ